MKKIKEDDGTEVMGSFRVRPKRPEDRGEREKDSTCKGTKSKQGTFKNQKHRCASHSKQGKGRVRRGQRDGQGPGHTGSWKPWGRGGRRFHSEWDRMGNYQRG